MKSNNPTVNVYLWDVFIGKLSWDPDAGRSVFSFSEDYLDSPFDLSPVTYSKERYKAKSFYGDKAFEGLPPFLADSLPDDWGNILFDKWTKDHNIPLNEMRSLLKLSFIGKRGMGALEFIPSMDMETDEESIDLASLYTVSMEVLHDREQVRLNSLENVSLHQLITLGTSAGGKHAKGIIAMNQDNDIRSGQISLPPGYRYYLLKFKEENEVPSCEIEKIFYDMAVEAGITMMPSRLFPIEGNNHFLTERFDRLAGGEKIHTQSLRALTPAGNDYMNLFWLCDRLHTPDGQKEELFRRMVFNFAAGVTDDHNRNHSFMMDRTGQWSLSPAYDVMFSANIWANPASAAHSLGMWQKRSHITLGDCIDFGLDIDIPNCRETVMKICRIVSSFPDRCVDAGINGFWTDRIWEVLKNLIAEITKPDSG